MARQTEKDSVPVQELKTPAMVSVRKFAKSVLIVLLSFVCIFVGMLIYQLRLPDEEFYPSAGDKKVNSILRKPVAVSLPVQSHKQTEPVLSPEETLENQPSIFVSKPKQKTKPVLKETKPEPEPTLNIPEVKTENEPVKPAEPMLPLEVALNLRDHLALGVSCFSEFKTIMKSRVPEGNRERLIEELMPVCANQSVFENMEQAFKENKKRALMTYYLLNNPKWLAYLKTVGTMLVDVRRLNPLKQKPKDIVALAQSALTAHDVSEAKNYIQKLPVEMRADFNEFLNLAAVYVRAQAATDRLILSFEKKGE